MPSTQLTVRDTATRERFGALDKRGTWHGIPQDLCPDEVILDAKVPADRTRVQRVANAALSLRQSGKIGDAEFIASERWVADWSFGTGHPLRPSEMRFLGVSLGGAGASDGSACSQLDSQTRHREARAAVGVMASERLMTYICNATSLPAAAALLKVSRQDLAAQIIADLQRLGEHYQHADSAHDAARRKRFAAHQVRS